MKIKFTKNERAEIGVVQKIDDKEEDFSYVHMIKALIHSKKMETPEISDGFTEEERRSIHSMVDHINAALNNTK
jgi:hypothetical protein